MRTLRLYIDGASRGNPGLAGAGVQISFEEQTLYAGSFFLGTKTNNQAEYLALVFGTICALGLLKPDDHLQIISDSELLVRQLNGIYRIHNSELLPLYKLAKKFLHEISYNVKHVLRTFNKQADKLANDAIDHKVPIPTELLALVRQHDIKI